MEDREQIIEEVQRRIDILQAARSASKQPADQQTLGALAELNDLLEWIQVV